VEARRRTWFDDRGLKVAAAGAASAQHLPFYAGAMHYWRVAPKDWAACLRTLRAQGLTIVDTFVPWRVHEPTAGAYDWRGAKDLGAFLAAAREAGLAVVLRPGPRTSAEHTSFGLPDHVLAEPACLARTSRGTPAWMPSPPRAWPVPSYASSAFHARVQAWYAEVARVVAPHLAPDGPVVAIGVDGEAQMFFRLGAYDLDYHDDAVTWWREASGHDGPPPRAWDPEDAARCIAWVRFKDQYLARALGVFAKALDDVGLAGIARFHNLPSSHHGYYDVRAIQRAIGGPAGLDAYTPRAGFRELRRRAHALAGTADPLPIAFEVGVGYSAFLPPLDTDERDADRERDHLLTLLAAGIRGFNLMMAVERDRHYGAAITKQGALEPHARWIAPLVRALDEVDWPSLRRPAPIALVASDADARFAHATSVVEPVTPVLAERLGLGPGGAAELGTDPAAITARRWLTAIASALELAQVPYVLVDDATPEAELARYRAVIAPTTSRVDRGLWTRLRALAEHPRGTASPADAAAHAEARRVIVVVGPDTPTVDELGQPLADPPPRRVGRIRAGSLDDLPGLAADLAALAGDLPEAWQVERPEGVRSFAYADASGTARLLFVVNDAPRAVTATLLADPAITAFRDPFTDETLRVSGGRLAIPLPPLGVRVGTLSS